MFSAVYISTSTSEFREGDLPALLEKSRENNGMADLTGMLLYREGRFLQALEGPEDTVRAVMSIIAADPRHEHIQVLAEEQIEERRFPAWSMGYPQVSDADVETLPGFTDFLSSNQRAFQDSSSRATLLLDWFRAH